MKPKNFSMTNPVWKDSIPRPVFEENPDYAVFYERAWELARDHMREIPGLPQSPYMDEAFISTDIWIWDTCFMMFFCKYAPDVFPGIETLNNFYKPLHEKGVKLPLITVQEDLPAWTGSKKGDCVQLKLHIPDNPPLFAWAESQYARMTGDRAHVEDLLLEKQYLQKHFAFFDSFTEPGWIKEDTRAPSCLVKLEDGYLWEGGRSGMDNTPRGRTGIRAEVERPNHPRMMWLDAIAQQGLAASCIAELATLIGHSGMAREWREKYEAIRKKINDLYWDDADGMYYDVHADTLEKMKCLTPASFWPNLSGMASDEQAARMSEAVRDPTKLGGTVPWVTVARDDPDFNPVTGNYWRGSVWLPTAYMGIKSLERYGQFELANANARAILEHMYRTWKEFEPHTIWECYRPNEPKPASHLEERVRPDFCGWSALGPISLFLENVIGIHQANAFTGELYWSLPKNRKGDVGVRNYSFGDITCDLICGEDGNIRVKTNRPFRLRVTSEKEYVFEISPGESVCRTA